MHDALANDSAQLARKIHPSIPIENPIKDRGIETTETNHKNNEIFPGWQYIIIICIKSKIMAASRNT